MVRQVEEAAATIDPDELLTRVDRRIVDSFRAQIEADPEVSADQRRAVLLDLLQQYWLQ